MKEKNNNIGNKRNSKNFLSSNLSTKNKSWKIKLVVIGLLFSFVLILSVGIINKFNSYSGDSINRFFAISSVEDEYYERLDEVQDEYKGEEKEFSEMVITSTFSILSTHVNGFSFDDMSKDRMREVADLMLKSVESDDGEVSFSSKNEDEVKESLVDYFKSIDSSLPDVTCTRMAEDVYDYIEAYLELIEKNKKNNGNMCLSTGNTQASIFLNMSTDEYIATMGPIAQADYSRNGVFASVTLAQSIIESGWGKSGLTQKANNMFGIKCSSNWSGECINMATGEYGSGGYYVIDANFRKYNSIEDSVNDHSLFLKENSRYPKAGVFDATTFEEQIRAIHRAGYATSPSYSTSIINTINRYDLSKWDVLTNVSSDLCYTGEGQWTIRTVAPTSSDYAFTVKSSNRGQCVWYAQARAYEVVLELAQKGVITNEQAESIKSKLFSIRGNGGDWVSASANILPTSTNINDLQAGALISWKKPGGYGHLAFI